LARGLGAPDGIEASGDNAFYISDNVGGDLFLVERRGSAPPKKVAQGLGAPADLVVDHQRRVLVIPENSANRLAVYQLDHHASH
jgi:hypothetical protein